MQIPHVTKPGEVSDDTAQTPNMRRLSAIDEKICGATRIYMGPAGGNPGPHVSLPHHHGEAETAVYCISGRLKVYYGPGYWKSVEFTPGDFLYVPAWLPHIEVNEWEEPCVTILTRSPANIVVNLEGEDVQNPEILRFGHIPNLPKQARQESGD